MKIHLTRAEAEAVLSIIDEREAGGTESVRDALGLDSESEAELIFDAFVRAGQKIRAAMEPPQ